jgi:hypothetical protein
MPIAGGLVVAHLALVALDLLVGLSASTSMAAYISLRSRPHGCCTGDAHRSSALCRSFSTVRVHCTSMSWSQCRRTLAIFFST